MIFLSCFSSDFCLFLQWFPGHKGLINGLIVAGFGLGALGSTTLQTMYLNPDNIAPQDDG